MEDELPRNNEKPQEAAAFVDVNSDCQSIVVNAPASEVYRRCLRFEDLPRFISSILEVDKISDTRFLCTLVINGQEAKILVQIMMRVYDRRIAWQAVSDNFRVGVITFDPLRDGRTRVTVKLRSVVEPALLGEALRRYLDNFKLDVESGGIRV